MKKEKGKRELNRINYSLLSFLNSESEDQSSDSILQKINALGKEYLESSLVKNNASRLREKNQIIRKICGFLIEDPDLIEQLLDTKNQGIISGIAYKIKTIPCIKDLEILELLSKKILSNFSKGNMVNSLSELVYSGQLRLGDDEKIKSILENLKPDADLPLQKNIERMEVALDYLLSR